MKNIRLNDREIEMVLKAISMMKDFRVKGSEEWKELYLNIADQSLDADIEFKKALLKENRKQKIESRKQKTWMPF